MIAFMNVLNVVKNCRVLRVYDVSITSWQAKTNSQILLKYFKLVFLQLHLVKVSCEMIIIWVNYERKKEVPFYEWGTKHALTSLLKYNTFASQWLSQKCEMGRVGAHLSSPPLYFPLFSFTPLFFPSLFPFFTLLLPFISFPFFPCSAYL